MLKRNLFAIGVLLATNFMAAKADVDPNFHIYLCFGQSNMEGNAQWEDQTWRAMPNGKMLTL